MKNNAPLVIIPAYNEEASISKVILSIKRHAPLVDILVINDGSTDSTAARVSATGSLLLDLKRNEGIS